MTQYLFEEVFGNFRQHGWRCTVNTAELISFERSRPNRRCVQFKPGGDDAEIVRLTYQDDIPASQIHKEFYQEKINMVVSPLGIFFGGDLGQIVEIISFLEIEPQSEESDKVESEEEEGESEEGSEDPEAIGSSKE